MQKVGVSLLFWLVTALSQDSRQERGAVVESAIQGVHYGLPFTRASVTSDKRQSITHKTQRKRRTRCKVQIQNPSKCLRVLLITHMAAIRAERS